ncbi:MAG: thioredoxin family protein [Myxococcales bacterium]|nr:thioredoxin family protein [Myxococcales bacterium]
MTAPTLQLGDPAPAFELVNVDGRLVRLDDYASKPLLVAFLCNHCPFVKHIADALGPFARDALDAGVDMVAINANDYERYPEDSPAAMKREVSTRGYGFPYLLDETQEVARAYGAACTPDFFLFDGAHPARVPWALRRQPTGRGRSVTGADLRHAIERVVAGEPVPQPHPASIGCGIKWRPSQEPRGDG